MELCGIVTCILGVLWLLIFIVYMVMLMYFCTYTAHEWCGEIFMPSKILQYVTCERQIFQQKESCRNLTE